MTSQRVKDLFGIDYRALAMFRIGLGCLLLLDLIGRAFDLTAFYTDFGILPRDFLLSHFHVPWTFAFHTWGGSTAYESILFALAGIFAIALILGIHTKPAVFLSWIFLISLQNRNEVIADGGDQLLRAFLLWLLFLPVGRRYSLDSLRKGATPEGGPCISVAAFALLMQMVFVYEFSGFSKTDPVWIKEGSACFYALASEQITKPFGLALLHFPGLLRFLTFATLFLEVVVPPLAFLPVYTKKVRLAIIPLFCLFHLGLFLSLELGLFPFVCMLGWVPFLPDIFWNRWERLKLVKGIGTFLQRYFQKSGEKKKSKKQNQPPSIIANSISAFLLLCVLAWNFKSFDSRFSRLFPSSLMPVARALRLDQDWRLFSPRPPTECGWHVFVGTLCDGTEVDLLKGHGAVSWDKPALVSSIYRGYRWRKYFKLFLSGPFAEHRLYYCQYLCRKWQRDEPRNPLKQVQLYYLKTPVLLKEPSPPANRYLVWEYDCGDCSPPNDRPASR